MPTQSDSASKRNAREFLRSTAPQWLGAAIGIVGTAAMLLVVEGLGPDVPTNTPVIIFLIPIVVSAYVGGLATGLLSTGIAILITQYFLLPPVHSWHVTSRTDVVKLISLAAVGGFVSFAMDRTRRSEVKLAAVHKQSSLFFTERKVRASFGFLVTCLVAIATVSCISVVRMNQDAAWVDHSHQVISGLRMLLATVTDGETGQRGYIITGRENYLEPYHSSVAHTKEVFRQVRDLTADNSEQVRRLNALASLMALRMAELDEGIDLRRTQGLEAAQRCLLTGKGKEAHDRIRKVVAELEGAEFILLHARQARAERAVAVTKAVIIGTGLLALILGGFAQFLVTQGFRASRLSEADLEQRVRERTDELAQVSRRIESILESAITGIVGFNENGAVTFANSMAVRLLGYEANEMMGRDGHSLWHSARRDGTVHGVEDCPIHRSIHKGTPERGEDWFWRKGGSGFPVMFASGPIEESGRLGGAVITFNDISERKQAEEALRLAQCSVEYASDIVHWMDSKGRILYANAAASRSLEYSREELLSLSIPEIDPLFPQERWDKFWKNVKQSGSMTFETQHRTKSGRVFPIEVTANYGEFDGKEYAFAFARDITERKRMEEAARQSELQYRGLFEHMSEGLAYCQMVFENGEPRDFIYLTVNSAFEALTGLKDVTGKRVTEAIPGIRESSPELLERYGRVARTGAPEKFEIFVAPLGIWFSISAYSPEKEFFVAVFDVITNRKRMEDSVRASETRYRRLFEAALDGILLLDAESGAITDVNPFLLDLLGYERNELLGRRLWEIGVFGDIVRSQEAFRTLRETGFVRYEDLPLQSKSKGRCEVEFISNVYEAGGEKMIQCNIRDITARLRSEEALRKIRMMFENLFEFSPDAIVATDSRGCITQLNAQAEKSFGYSRNELMGQSIELLVPERYRGAHSGHRLEYAAKPFNRPMGSGLELYGRRKDGAEFPADIQLTTIETDEGPLVLTVTRDVTERKRAQQEIQQINTELEQRVRDRTAQLESSNKELEAFAYTVSHDLRAPVRHLSAFSESLRKRSYENLDERARHYLDNIHTSSQQMGALIDDLLKFSRLGRAGMSKVDVAPGLLVEEVRRELEPDIAERNLVWKVSQLPELYADAALLKQVFVNLMSNAVKYTRGREESRIEIGCTNGTPGERVIFIRDNGVGFEMAYVDKLFKVFQRLHTEFEGTGIGLANVRRIIERHGGRVWAEGVPEQGATFSFSIPTREGG